MVTARDSEIDKVVGLEIGPTTTSPSPIRRVSWWPHPAVLRRQATETASTAGRRSRRAGADGRRRHVVTVAGRGVQLPLKEFELLELLLRNAGRVLTRGQLIDRCGARTTSATPKRLTCM
jgi:two-component system response regulator RegX3